MKRLLMLATTAFVGFCALADSPSLKFGFLTDTHVGAGVEDCTRARSALTLFREKGVELVVHAGDVANRYDQEAFAAYKSAFDEAFPETKPTQLIAIGNHDTMETGGQTPAEAAAAMLTTLGAANTHTDVKTVGGCTFLVMPCAENVGQAGFLTWEEYETRVRDACEANPGKPVFVVEHEPPQNTVYNSRNWGSAQVRAVLNKYPQVVELSGHVHGSLRNDLFVWQGEFTVINACCLHQWNGLLNGETDPTSKNSYGVLTVEVFADRIVARRWNVLDGSEIDPGHPWTIPLPFVAETAPYNRAALVAAEVVPSFPDGAVTTVFDEKTCRDVDVSFPSLSDSVMTYWIALDRVNDDGTRQTLVEKEIFSDFWREPGERTGAIASKLTSDALEPCAKYAVSVQPVGQYGKRGAAQEVVFRAPDVFPEETPDWFVDYVETDGRHYVDTKVIGRSGTKAEIDIKVMEMIQGQCDLAILNVRKDGGDTRFFLFHTANRKPAFGYQTFIYTPSMNDAPMLDANTRYRMASELIEGRQTFELNGRNLYTGTNPATVDTGKNLYLFANNYGSTPQNLIKAQCYGLKIWQTDETGAYRLVRDFAPCVKNGVHGLFDRVSKRIFYGKKVSDKDPENLGGPSSFGTKTVQGKPDRFVEYVQSNGRQIIDTGVAARTGIRVEGDMLWDSGNIAREQTYLGINQGGSFYLVHSVWHNAPEVWLSYGDAYRIYPESAPGTRYWHKRGEIQHFDIDYSTTNSLAYKLDGTTVWSLQNAPYVSTGNTLTLFAANQYSAAKFPCFARCYGLKMWLDGVLVRDFRPCVKDGKGGLYDAVHDEVLFPAGPFEGADAIGPTTDEDGNPMALVKSVSSTGNCYIDTEVIGKNGTKVEADFEYIEVGGDLAFMGARKEQNTDTRLFPFHCNQSKACLGYKRFITPSPNFMIKAGTRYHLLSVLESGNQTVDIDGTRVYTGTDPDSIDTGRNMFLFALNFGGTAGNQSKIRLYGLKIWQKGENGDYLLVRDFEPAMRIRCSDRHNNGCLYDAVSRKLFLPKGNDWLTVPNEPIEVADEPDRLVEYIQSDGRQTLNTGVAAKTGIKAEGDFMFWSEIESEQCYLGSYVGSRLYFIHQANHQAWAAYGPDGQEIYKGYLNRPDGSKLFYESGVKYHFVADCPTSGNATLEVNGETIISEPTPEGTDVRSLSSLCVFSCGAGGGLFSSAARCYGLKLWQVDDQGVRQLVRDYVPAVKDGKGCLYDRQSGHLFFPFGAPIVGANIGPDAEGTPLVRESRLEYIESDGSVWLDTGVIGRSGTKAELTFMPLYQLGVAGEYWKIDMGLLGARSSLYGNDNRIFLGHVSQGLFAYGYGGFVVVPSPRSLDVGSLTTGVVHKAVADLTTGSQTVVLDGVTVADDGDVRTIDAGLPLYLFAVNVGGEAMYGAKARVYRLKIWQDGELVRDFRPMMTEGGEAAFWDSVTKSFFFGSRPFTSYGPVTGPADVGGTVILK